MTGAKMVTAHEAVMRERRAWVAGHTDGVRSGGSVAHSSLPDLAAREYPLAKVTRPRLVVDPHDPRGKWQVFPVLVHDPLGFAHPDVSDGDFYNPPQEFSRPTPARVALWADLLANPTEEVEEDA